MYSSHLALDITARMCWKLLGLCLCCSVISSAACRDTHRLGGKDRSTRLSRPSSTLSKQTQLFFGRTYLAAVMSPHTWSWLSEYFSAEGLVRRVLSKWKSLWCLFRRRKGEQLSSPRSSFSPYTRPFFTSSLVAVLCGLWFWLRVPAPAVQSCLLEAAATAASVPLHHWPTMGGWKGGVGVVNVWNKGISRKTTSRALYAALTNKWIRLSLPLRMRPSCSFGIQEVSPGDRSFIVT